MILRTATLAIALSLLGSGCKSRGTRLDECGKPCSEKQAAAEKECGKGDAADRACWDNQRPAIDACFAACLESVK